MNITIKCADCGRQITTRVLIGKKVDTEIEIHACYHGQRYGKKELIEDKYNG